MAKEHQSKQIKRKQDQGRYYTDISILLNLFTILMTC